MFIRAKQISQIIVCCLFSIALIVPTPSFSMGKANTNKVVRRINNDSKICASLPSEYRADCLSQTFKRAASVAGNMVDYVRPAKELRKAHKRIDAIVSKNVDTSKPVISKRGKKFRAVKKAAVAKVNAAAKKVVTETATLLLRSAGNSNLRKTHFGHIAKAVNSTKNILRST